MSAGEHKEKTCQEDNKLLSKNFKFYNSSNVDPKNYILQRAMRLDRRLKILCIRWPQASSSSAFKYQISAVRSVTGLQHCKHINPTVTVDQSEQLWYRCWVSGNWPMAWVFTLKVDAAHCGSPVWTIAIFPQSAFPWMTEVEFLWVQNTLQKIDE